MRRRIIAVIALIPALLFGCAGPTTNTTAQTGNTSSQEVAQEDSTQNSVTLTALQRSDGWNYGGSGSDGFYYVSSSVRDDGSANLMYLDYATRQARRHIPMTMEDWKTKLDAFLRFNDAEVLQDKGKITAAIAKEFAESEFEKYRVIQDSLYESDFDKLMKNMES